MCNHCCERIRWDPLVKATLQGFRATSHDRILCFDAIKEGKKQMGIYRGFIVWGAGIVLVLGAFLIFVLAGWPGAENNCIHDTPNSCYCEAFNRAQVVSGAPGVRQPVNTWFNLYSIMTSFVVALMVYFDRTAGGAPNPIRSDDLVPDLYIFAVQFLGLGSMWFHGSLKEWGGWLDLASMFVYAAFLVFYSVRRFWSGTFSSNLFFWGAYGGTVALFTIVGGEWQWKYKSLILILILVAAYLAIEFYIWGSSGKWAQGKVLTQFLWLAAVVAIGLATLFWALSQTGGPLCDPNSFFQPHGLLWHPLAGVMAVLLYFYWREDEGGAQP